MADENVIEEEIIEVDNNEEENKVEEEMDSTPIMENKTNFTKEGFSQMNKEVAKKSYYLVFICEAILLAIDVWLYISKSWAFAIIASVLIVIYPFILKFSASSHISKNFLMYENAYKNAGYDYAFYETRMTLHFTYGDDPNNFQDGEVPYTSIYYVIENNDFLFIFISANQAYIVDKKGFEEEGDVPRLLDLLKSKEIKIIDRSKKTK